MFEQTQLVISKEANDIQFFGDIEGAARTGTAIYEVPEKDEGVLIGDI